MNAASFWFRTLSSTTSTRMLFFSFSGMTLSVIMLVPFYRSGHSRFKQDCINLLLFCGHEQQTKLSRHFCGFGVHDDTRRRVDRPHHAYGAFTVPPAECIIAHHRVGTVIDVLDAFLHIAKRVN